MEPSGVTEGAAYLRVHGVASTACHGVADTIDSYAGTVLGVAEEDVARHEFGLSG